jgi:hypothetical protein
MSPLARSSASSIEVTGERSVAAPPTGFRHAEHRQAEFIRLREEFVAHVQFFIGVVRRRAQHVLRKGAHRIADHLLLFGDVEVEEIGGVAGLGQARGLVEFLPLNCRAAVATRRKPVFVSV